MRSTWARGIALVALAVALIVLLSATGPNLENQISGPLRRAGGACLSLEKWGLFGWRELGQTRTVHDTQNGIWHDPVAEPPCADVPHQIYLVRPPFDAPTGSYRICGLADEEPCIEFERIEFVNDELGP